MTPFAIHTIYFMIVDIANADSNIGSISDSPTLKFPRVFFADPIQIKQDPQENLRRHLADFAKYQRTGDRNC
jgi:hypothetical protein